MLFRRSFFTPLFFKKVIVIPQNRKQNMILKLFKGVLLISSLGIGLKKNA